MPIEAVRVTLADVGNDRFNSIIIKAKTVEAVDQLVLDIDDKLRYE